MKTAIIIPNYNGLHFLPPCMEALNQQSQRDFLTIVVDNGSTDGSLTWLEHWASEDTQHRLLMKNPENLGFSSAVNLGICEATERGLLYALLLNNDTRVFPDFLEQLEAEMERDTQARLFAVQSRMIKMHDESIMDDAGDQYTLLGWGFMRGLEEPVNRWNQPSSVFSACAGASIYRISILRETGLFDVHHFAYLEDMDISYRAQLYGYEVRYLPTAVCRHVGSGTSGSKYNAFKVRLSSRNSIYLPYKNMPNLQLVLNSPFLLLGYLVKYLFFARLGFEREYREGILEGISTRKSLTRADFSRVPVSRLLWIEFLLLRGTWEYLGRMIRKMIL